MSSQFFPILTQSVKNGDEHTWNVRYANSIPQGLQTGDIVVGLHRPFSHFFFCISDFFIALQLILTVLIPASLMRLDGTCSILTFSSTFYFWIKDCSKIIILEKITIKARLWWHRWHWALFNQLELKIYCSDFTIWLTLKWS